MGRNLLDPALYIAGERALLGCSLMYEVNCIVSSDKRLEGETHELHLL